MKKGLGKGLGALISSASDNETPENNVAQSFLDINRIKPNREQPRKRFDDESLSELADSIRLHGVVQPLIVTADGDFYRIVAGERRWRAARIAGVSEIPVVIRDYDELQILQIALIENLQRSDLNPMEEAASYRKLIDDFSLSQEEVARQIGKSRSAVANTLRLLSLCEPVAALLQSGRIQAGHGRTLIGLSENVQLELAERVIEEELSVRELEQIVRELSDKKEDSPPKKASKPDKSPEISRVEGELSSVLGTKVQVRNSGDKGKIVIEYYSRDELDRLFGFMKRGQ